MNLKYEIKDYLANQPTLKLLLEREKDQLMAELHGQNGGFSLSFKGVSKKVCPGCAVELGKCSTGGVCKLEHIKPENLGTRIQQLESGLECNAIELKHLAAA